MIPSFSFIFAPDSRLALYVGSKFLLFLFYAKEVLRC